MLLGSTVARSLRVALVSTSLLVVLDPPVDPQAVAPTTSTMINPMRATLSDINQ
jgi:hypothetical protein